jgi:hypothetical protein
MQSIRRTAALAFVAFLLLLSDLAGAGNFIRGTRGASIVQSCILTATCGASAYAGQTDDPTTSATAYSPSTTYAEGAWVTNGGSYFFSRKSANVNNPTSDSTYWWPATTFYYFDVTATPGSCSGSTNPATAKAAPCQTLLQAYDLLDTGGTANAPRWAVLLFKCNQQFDGGLTVSMNDGSAHGLAIIGAYGTGCTSQPEFRYDNNTARYFTGAVINVLAQGTVVRNIRINPYKTTNYGFTPGTGTFASGDTVSRASDGTRIGTVWGTPQNNRIIIKHAVDTEFYSIGEVIQTAGGAKTGTLTTGNTTRTPVSGITANAQNVRIVNVEVFDALGNGIGAGTGYPNYSSADNLYVFNTIVHDTAKWGGAGGGMQGGWGSNIKIKRTTAYNNGGNNTFSHQYYLDDLSNSEFSENYGYMTGPYGNHCLVIHGLTSDLDIHDNDCNGTQNGIGINDGYSGAWAEGFTRTLVYRNMIRNQGQYNGSGLIFDLAGIVDGKFWDNIAYNNKYVVSITNYAHTQGANLTTNNLLFAYNTIVSDATVGNDALIKVQSNTGTDITGLAVKNNIFVSKNAAQPTFNRLSTTAASAVALENNDIWNTTGRTNVITWGGTGYSASTFSGATNGNATNIQADPLFTDEAAANFILQAISTAKAAAQFITGLTADVKGVPRNASTPTMGAFE